MPVQDTTRTNDRIRVPQVRLIDETGAQLGVMDTGEALRIAQGKDLDLVEVAPEAKPPVCRILDYSKYKYEQAQKVKQAKKHQQQINVREIKFRPKIAAHDYATKKGHVERFLRDKDKVKVTIMFRGREVTHPERGTMILDRLAEELADLGVVEQRPMQEGRNMTMMMAPSKAVLAGRIDSDGSVMPAPEDGAEPTTPTPADTPAATAETPAEDGAAPTEQAPAATVETLPEADAAAAEPQPAETVEIPAEDGESAAAGTPVS